MKLGSILAFLSLAVMLATSAEANSVNEKPLIAQVEHLTALLRDSQARGYPQATMIQSVSLGAGPSFVLVLFIIEGFGGGNNYSQYLAAFEPSDDEDSPHYSLIDVIHVAGRGWRSIEKLDARVSRRPDSRDVHIELDAMENGPQDSPNFPSRKAVIQLVLSQGRLELKSKRK